MSVSGLCQVCESAPARYQCGRCGTLACEDHFDAESRLCADCAAESGVRDRDREGGPGFGGHRL
jgi:hypothetical protein